MRPGDIVFISASVPHRPGWKEESRPSEIEEAIVSVARAVFSRGGRLLFGGHPSVSFLIASVAGEYFEPDPARVVRPVITFQSELFRRSLPDETWLLHRMGWSSIEWTEELSGRDTSLRLMREWMLLGPNLPDKVRERNQLTPPKAMVAIGGMEGVIDEAVLFLDHAKLWKSPTPPRIYTLPSGGGAAARLLRAEDSDLRHARTTGLLVDLEQRWREEDAKGLPDDLPFVPYAAVVQYMLDGLLD